MSSLKHFLNDKSNKSEVDQYFEDQAKFLIEKQKLERIDNFNGYFDFLNNDYPCDIYFEGLIFKSVSHAYQAARSKLQHIREKIALADSIIEMYDIAAKIEDPLDWLKMRIKVMEKLVRDKFRRHRDLRDKLKATSNRELINTYADATNSNIFWGIVDNKGQNQLGRIIENVRYDIQTNVELEKWLFITFNLVEDRSLIPIIQLDILKGGDKIENIKLKEKSYYMMGSFTSSDILMTHQSISRRHAVLIVDSKDGVCLIDLGSKGGSYIDGQRVNVCFPYRLKSNQILNFAVSTRRYAIDVDYSLVEKNIMYKKKQIELEMKTYEELKDPNVNADVVKSSLGLTSEDTIFVANLPDHCSIKELQEFFEVYGKVKNIRIPIDHVSGKSRNIGFVTFENEKDMRNVLNQDGMYYKDKKIRINKAEKRISDIKNREKFNKNEKILEKPSKKDTLEKHEERVKRDFDDRFKKNDRIERGHDNRRNKDNQNENKNGQSKIKEGDRYKADRRDQNRSKRKRSRSKSHSRSRSRSRSRDRKYRLKHKSRTSRSRSRSRSRSKSRSISRRRKNESDNKINDRKKQQHKRRYQKKSSSSRSSSESDSESQSNSESISRSKSKSKSKPKSSGASSESESIEKNGSKSQSKSISKSEEKKKKDVKMQAE